MKLLTQIAVLFGICLLGESISVLLPFAFPATVISMILLFILLISGLLKTNQIQTTADFLSKNMALFLIPPGVGIISSLELLEKNILPFLLIVLITTILTFAAAAYTVQGVMWLQNKLTGKKEQEEASDE
jgi:holin-like protein